MKQLGGGESHDGNAKYICAATGKAVTNNEAVRVIPIESKMSNRKDQKLIYQNNHSVTGLYGLVTASIKAKYSAEEEKIIVSGEMMTKQSQMIITGTDVDKDSSSQDKLDLLMNGDLKPNTMRGSTNRDFMIVSEKAFNAVCSSVKVNGLQDDFAEWTRQLTIILAMDFDTKISKEKVIEHFKENNMYVEELDHHYLMKKMKR